MSHDHPPGIPASDLIGACTNCGANLYLGDRFCIECGQPIPHAADIELLTDLREVTLGEYDIVGVLGRGGMGLVYLAHEIMLNRKVAVKVLLPSLLRGPEVVERFRREARIAASLRHRNITSIFGLKETSKLHFFVMEYVEGRSLDLILRDQGSLDFDLARTVLLDVASALSYAHAKGITHRDIKPGNIIIDTEGIAVVTDFGIAKVSGATGLTSTGSAVGSPNYMSPEQWSGKATSLSDQYALGCTAYQMITGRTPFETETIQQLIKQQLLGEPRDLRELCPECPPDLAGVVMRMLEREPTDRWPTFDEAIAAIGIHVVPPNAPERKRLAEMARQGHEVRSLPSTPQSPIPVTKEKGRAGRPDERRRERSRPAAWVAAAVIVVAAALGLYRFVWLPQQSVPEPQARQEAPPPEVEQRPGAVEADSQITAPAVGEETESVPAPEPPEPQPTSTTPVQEPLAAPQEPAVLQMLISPVWARVSIDGISRGSRARGVDTLQAGIHRLRFERAGYVTVDTTVNLRPGELLRLRVQMRQRNP